MKQMVYSNRHKADRLHSGVHRGIDFVILSLGSHPTAYVRIPETHEWYKKDYMDIDIDCHGGLTFASTGVSKDVKTKDGWWVGWDYAHDGDFSGYGTPWGTAYDKKYSTEEIFRDVKEVIEQVKSAHNTQNQPTKGTNKGELS